MIILWRIFLSLFLFWETEFPINGTRYEEEKKMRHIYFAKNNKEFKRFNFLRTAYSRVGWSLKQATCLIFSRLMSRASHSIAPMIVIPSNGDLFVSITISYAAFAYVFHTMLRVLSVFNYILSSLPIFWVEKLHNSHCEFFRLHFKRKFLKLKFSSAKPQTVMKYFLSFERSFFKRGKNH